jgi:hypothetical protein
MLSLDGAIPVGINDIASGDTTLVAAVTGSRVIIWRLFLWANGSVNVTFKDTGGAILIGPIAMTAGTSFELKLRYPSFPWIYTTVSTGFVLNLSGAVQVSGSLLYTRG